MSRRPDARLVLSRLLAHRGLLVVALLWAAIVLLAPSVQPSAAPPSVGAGALTSLGPPPGVVTPGTLQPTVAATTTPAGTGVPTSRGHRGSGEATSPPATTSPHGHASYGVSRAGVVCRPGAVQLTDTTYSPPCQPAFHGDNGGATSNGVTGNTIRIAFRYASSPVLDNTPSADYYAVAQTWVNHFNKTYELYGRHVVLDYYKSPHGDPVQEAQGQGGDEACEDALTLAQQHHDFGVLYSDSQPFMRCAAEQHLVIFDAEGRPLGAYLDQLDPYVWGDEEDCNRVVDQTVEYVGKRLVGRTAKYAGDPAMHSKKRVFGLIYPDNDTYQPCVAEGLRILKDVYHTNVVTYAYAQDITRLGDQAAQAVLRFKSAGVTTLIDTTDYITMQLLTKAAANEDWRPEWIDAGTGSTDFDPDVQGDDQSEIDGHLFGRTDDATFAQAYGPHSEEEVDYRHLTGKELPADTDGYYYSFRQLFRFLQAAGPELTPADVARGAYSLPPEHGVLGTLNWNLADDGTPGTSHEGCTDSISIWWEASANHGEGGFVQIDGDRRYGAGQWPRTEPKPPR
jgi:hypothetical protein